MNRKAKERLHDRVCYTILKAPDHFPADTGMTLQKTFQQMQEHLTETYDPGTNEHTSIMFLLDSALESYKKPDQKQAIRQLQAIEDFLAGRTRELSSYS